MSSSLDQIKKIGSIIGVGDTLVGTKQKPQYYNAVENKVYDIALSDGGGGTGDGSTIKDKDGNKIDEVVAKGGYDADSHVPMTNQYGTLTALAMATYNLSGNNFTPINGNGTGSVGTSSSKWKEGYINQVSLNNLTSAATYITLFKDILPSANKTVNLGSDDKYFKIFKVQYCSISNDGYVNTPRILNTVANSSVSFGNGSGNDNFSPLVNNIHDLGKSDKKWRNAHIVTLYSDELARADRLYPKTNHNLQFGNGVGTAEAFIPYIDNAHGLGNSTYKWKEGYINTMFSNYLKPGNTGGDILFGSNGSARENILPWGSSKMLGNPNYVWNNVYTNKVTFADGTEVTSAHQIIDLREAS